MAYFPFLIDVSAKKVLIVGGGSSAYHKVKSLAAFGASVVVVAESVSPDIKKMFGDILVFEKAFEEKDLAEADYVIAAAGDKSINLRIAALARQHGKLVNAVDDKDYCDFIFPAILKKENYSVAVCTEGRSPLMAQEIRNEIARIIPDEYDEAVGELGRIRESIIHSSLPGKERTARFKEKAAKLIGRRKVRLGTRGSALALAQTEMVMKALSEKGIETEAVIITTEGDRNKEKPLWSFGGKSVFVSEFEEAILKGRIDVAIHSAKDMPAALPEGLAILACLKREDPADVLVSLAGRRPEDIRLVGTGSRRRQALIEALSDRYETRPLRGNVPSRINKLRRGEYDAVILAAAGLKRLELDKEPDLRYERLDPARFTPAAGQGVIAVEGLVTSDTAALIREIDHPETRLALTAERRFMQAIRADCHDAVAAWAFFSDNKNMEIQTMKYEHGRFAVGSASARAEDEASASRIAEDAAEQVLGGAK